MPYRKRTRIWTNVKTWTPRPLCKKDCGSMDGNRHKEVAQRGPSSKGGNHNNIIHKQEELYKIPSTLIYEMLSTLNQQQLVA